MIDSTPAPQTRRWSAVFLAACLPLLALLTGCPTGVPPRTVAQAIDRVNEHLSRIDQPLYCKNASVSFSFRDASGATRRFIGHPATIIFQQSRSLYFDIKSLAGSVARIGSNDERYWFWVDVGDTRKLWWGAWALIGESPPGRLPIPPNDLLDALMVRPLPVRLVGGAGPVLRVEGDDHRLVYIRVGADSIATGMREIRLDPRPPYMPLEVIDRSRDGGIVMHARLSRYAPVTKGGPLTAREYQVEWPETGARMSLSIGEAKFRPDQPPFDEFPPSWDGEVECLDEVLPTETEEESSL